MRFRKVVQGLRAFGAATVALAAVLVSGHPAAAEAERPVVGVWAVEGSAGTPTVMADRSCWVSTSSCFINTPLWFNSNSQVHFASQGVPATIYAVVYAVPTADPANAFPIGSTYGNVDTWRSSWVPGNYIFEFYCSNYCSGAALYVTRN
jgi:hypothetical protein